MAVSVLVAVVVVDDWSTHLSIRIAPSTQRRMPSSAVTEKVVLPPAKLNVPVHRTEKLLFGIPPPGPPVPQSLSIVVSQRVIVGVPLSVRFA